MPTTESRGKVGSAHDVPEKEQKKQAENDEELVIPAALAVIVGLWRHAPNARVAPRIRVGMRFPGKRTTETKMNIPNEDEKAQNISEEDRTARKPEEDLDGVQLEEIVGGADGMDFGHEV